MSCVVYVSESCHTYVSHLCVTLMCVLMNWACHRCEWVVSLIWLSRVTRVNESYDACEQVIWRVWMSHITRVNESNATREDRRCYATGWVMRHKYISMSRVTHVNENVTHTQVSAVTRLMRKWHILRWLPLHDLMGLAFRCAKFRFCLGLLDDFARNGASNNLFGFLCLDLFTCLCLCVLVCMCVCLCVLVCVSVYWCVCVCSASVLGCLMVLAKSC